MSLITCCPACQTMFQVSGDDLRVSDGWVRCGKCSGVFDASAHLQLTPPAQEESTALPAAWAPEADLPQAVVPVASVAPALPTQTLSPSQAAAFPVDERPSLFRAATLGDATAFRSVSAPVGAAEFAEAEVQEQSARAEPHATLRREDRSARPSFTQEPVSFAGRPSPVRSRWRLVFWLVALALLGLALLGWARHERQALVQRLPALLPALDALCTLSACDVKAPRLLDVILIEGASMQEVAPTQYKIQLVLKNVGAGPVELPALRATLTGLQGEDLAGHIALPSQFAPGVTRLAPNAPLSVAVTFSVLVPAAVPPEPVPAVAVPAASEPAVAVASVAASSAPAAPAALPASQSTAVAEATSALVAQPVRGYRVIAFYP